MKKKTKSGPVPDRVKIEQDWEKAMADAMKKKRPKEGWPKAEKEEKSKE
jgi:hypothetical protein